MTSERCAEMAAAGSSIEDPLGVMAEYSGGAETQGPLFSSEQRIFKSDDSRRKAHEHIHSLCNFQEAGSSLRLTPRPQSKSS